MIADVSGFLDQHDREIVLPAFFRKLTQANGGGESGGAASHDQDVDFELIAFRHSLL